MLFCINLAKCNSVQIYIHTEGLTVNKMTQTKVQILTLTQIHTSRRQKPTVHFKNIFFSLSRLFPQCLYGNWGGHIHRKTDLSSVKAKQIKIRSDIVVVLCRRLAAI